MRRADKQINRFMYFDLFIGLKMHRLITQIFIATSLGASCSGKAMRKEGQGTLQLYACHANLTKRLWSDKRFYLQLSDLTRLSRS